MSKFLLNNIVHDVSDVDPNTSVLEYLRDHVRRTGTKEGCASGDCGACTVVVAELVGEKLQYKSINACITTLATLHGKQLLTVEDLKQDGRLHPVQQAMVDCDSSQCGFCTPGFVMSMFAYEKNTSTPSRETINEALGGNLCRCTGYRPIIDAAQQLFEKPLNDQFTSSAQQTIECLKGISAKQSQVSINCHGKQFFAPTNIQTLGDLLLANPEARLLAGGTDLSLELTQNLEEIDTLIYTGNVGEMLQINVHNDAIEIGAAVTYSQCKAVLVEAFADLHELFDRLGSRQVRNQGTIGGNVANASPVGDMPPVLMALGAKLLLRRAEQTRWVPVQDFFQRYKVTVLEPGEFIEKIVIPTLGDNDHFRVYKVSKRLEDDISATCAAFALNIVNGVVESARIAFGGMAEIPKRALHCEKALLNQQWNEASIAVAKQAMRNDFAPISDFRASANYRMQVSQNLLQRFYWELDSFADQVRVTHYA